MPRSSLGTALVLLVLLSSTSGCMGLIAAREGVESLREPAFESLTNEKMINFLREKNQAIQEKACRAEQDLSNSNIP